MFQCKNKFKYSLIKLQLQSDNQHEEEKWQWQNTVGWLLYHISSLINHHRSILLLDFRLRITRHTAGEVGYKSIFFIHFAAFCSPFCQQVLTGVIFVFNCIHLHSHAYIHLHNFVTTCIHMHLIEFTYFN